MRWEIVLMLVVLVGCAKDDVPEKNHLVDKTFELCNRINDTLQEQNISMWYEDRSCYLERVSWNESMSIYCENGLSEFNVTIRDIGPINQSSLNRLKIGTKWQCK